MLLPPKYVILTLLLQCLVETGIFILARILADRLEPPAPALLIVPEKDAEENVRSKFDRRRTRYSHRPASFPRICHGRSCARSCTPTLQSC